MKNIIKTIRSSLVLIIASISFSVFAFGQSENHLKRAISAMETGLFEESLRQLNYALNDDPKNAQVHKLKALLYEALEKKEKAIEAWNDCIRYSKDQNMIKEAKIHLNHLNGI
jgi:tetratricopeptide (TPR) repeat protein